MAQAAARDLVDARDPRRGRRLLHRHLRGACASEGRERALQLGAPCRVARMLEPVADPRVEDNDRDVLWQRDEPVLLGGAVEQERVAAMGEQAHRRVHEADRHADGSVLRLARDVRELESRKLEARRPAEREPDRDRQRRRGRQPGADRHRGRHPSVEPDRRPAPLGQERGDGGRVAAPAGEPGRRRPVGRELHHRLGERGRPEPDGVRVWPPVHRHAAIDGHRQDEPA